jgi:Ca2+-binding RTX toxin-like protein
VNADLGGHEANITLGDGAGDVVNAGGPVGGFITLGNGAGDVVNANSSFSATITLGNGNDTIHVGFGDTVTVGTGKDSFVFDQTAPGSISAVTINHFNPSKDVISLSKQLTTTITLVGVHASALHPSDFHFA